MKTVLTLLTVISLAACNGAKTTESTTPTVDSIKVTDSVRAQVVDSTK